MKRVQAQGRVEGMWCIRSPWHNGAWIGGYYNPANDHAVTVANPDDLNDYDDRVEIHEIAHRVEWKEDVRGRWHNAAWRDAFLNWWDMPQSARPCGGRQEMCDALHELPYCKRGDAVVVDVVT